MATVTLPIKSDETCSNIFLLDERLCLDVSLDVINFNFNQLQSNLNVINNYGQQWNNLFTVFANNSSRWFTSSTNVYSLSSKWVNTYQTINSLSATWCKEFSLYYPTILEINSWYALNTNAKNSIATNWLNLNFPASSFPKNQIISFYINLYQQKPFTFSFMRSLYEPCTPNGGGASVSCGQCPTPSRGCNHHGGRAGYGPCTNAYDGCSKQTTGYGTQSFSCRANGYKTLVIGKTQNYVDTSTARVIRLRFQNINNNWSAI
jgi:hypothetical protein